MSTWANVDEKPAPPKTFELTPLSSLLKQSFADIRALRAQQERSEGAEGCAENIDFDKVNENLRNFTKCVLFSSPLYLYLLRLYITRLTNDPL